MEVAPSVSRRPQDSSEMRLRQMPPKASGFSGYSYDGRVKKVGAGTWPMEPIDAICACE